MRDKTLHDQNCQTLESYEGNILVCKIDKLKQVGLVDIEHYNAGLMVRDEDQYGCGEDSTFDFAFFKNIRKAYPQMPIVQSNNTDACIMNGQNVFVAVSSYFGLNIEDAIVINADFISSGGFHTLHTKNFKLNKKSHSISAGPQERPEGRDLATGAGGGFAKPLYLTAATHVKVRRKASAT